MRRIMRGETESTLGRLSERYSEIGEMGEDTNVVLGYAAQELFKLVERDELNEALEMIQPLSAAYPLVRSWTAGVAWIQFLSGAADDAKKSLCRFDDTWLSALFREAGGGVGIATVAEVIASVGTTEQAQTIYNRLQPVSNRCAAAGYGVLYMGCYARYCGLLAGSLGHMDDAIEYLQRAIAHEEKVGALAWKGYSEIDLALHLHARNRHDELVHIASNSAKKTCEKVGTARLNRRLHEALETISG
jgi:tetratricopeptide (TPR) repeat protein